jgi:epoxyqueuosine reductase
LITLIENEKLKKLARSIGIDQLGVTKSISFENLRGLLETRISEHYFTPFEEHNLELRLHPEYQLNNCCSIITLAVPYATAERNQKLIAIGPRGSVARCARAVDYHLVLKKKAETLVELIQKNTDHKFNYRILADRSPLLEREIARRCGLGLIAENCTFINDLYGSYVALCTILIDVSIEPDNAVEKLCLQCGECRTACPTGALSEPYILNPQRCLSYLTQAAGVFPRELRTQLETKIYGCDHCQEVCPLNNQIKSSPLSELSFELFPAEPLLLPLLNITHREFDLTVKLTSAGWRGKTTLQRNVIIALGNSKDQIAVRPLARILENDSRPLIRLHASWSLGQLGGRQACLALEKSAKRDPEESVRQEALAALKNNA